MKTLVVLLTSLFLTVTHAADNQALLNEIITKAQAAESDSLVVIENQKQIHTSFAKGSDQLLNVQSITKSVCALALAFLIDEGKISSFDAPMSTWFTEWKDDSQKSQITLRMILNHTAGYPDVEEWPQFFKSDDLVTGARGLPLVSAPGVQFKYSSIATCLLQLVISQSAGMSVEEYVKLKLFTPLHIDSYAWRKDKKGQESLGGGLSLKTDGLIKLGLFMLNKGVVDNRRILSSERYNEMLAKSQTFTGYGLFWWLSAPTAAGLSDYRIFSAIGWGGQYIVVYPEKNLIVIRTKNPYDIDDDKYSQQAFGEIRSLVAKWQ